MKRSNSGFPGWDPRKSPKQWSQTIGALCLNAIASGCHYTNGLPFPKQSLILFPLIRFSHFRLFFLKSIRFCKVVAKTHSTLVQAYWLCRLNLNPLLHVTLHQTIHLAFPSLNDQLKFSRITCNDERIVNKDNANCIWYYRNSFMNRSALL